MFPIYRKYPDGRALFKIVSEKEFEEISFIGEKAVLTAFSASIYPDFLLISDMINMEDGYWIESSQEEFERVRKEI